jgi:tetratricopeptide (TPR) repeat protein
MQGLEQLEDEDFSSSSQEEDPTGSWINEFEKELPEPEEPDEASDREFSPEDALPVWVNELSTEETEPDPTESEWDTNPLGKQGKDVDEDEIVKVDQSNIAAFPGETNEELPGEEGFIEISDLALESDPEDVPSISDLQPNDDAELPQWLKEMVSESNDEDLAEIIHPTEGDLGITKPADEESVSNELINETSETRSFTEIEESDHSELITSEIEEIEDLNTEKTEPSEAGDGWVKEEEIIHSAEEAVETQSIEEDTIPINISSEPTGLSEEDLPSESRFYPNILMEAKIALDEGQYEKALETLNIYVEEKAYLEEIQNWLEDLVVNQKSENFKVWEALGNTYLQKGFHYDAIGAYANASKYLLRTIKEDYGIN